MDVIFDIDGTLADATHRLHLIEDPAFWVHLKEGKPLTPNWEAFLSDEQVAKDEPIEETFILLNQYLNMGRRILFITGRREEQRITTRNWLCWAYLKMDERHMPDMVGYRALKDAPLLMRKSGDRRPSDLTKQDCLMEVRSMGYNPTLVFEDRADDAAMWRRNGLLCMHVAEGNF